MKTSCFISLLLLSVFSLSVFSCNTGDSVEEVQHDPVDYVNPYMGNISHLLIPTYPMVHLPNSMMRMTPNRSDYTDLTFEGLPLMLTSHRGAVAYSLSPTLDEPHLSVRPVLYTYDREECKPYSYQVALELGQENIEVGFVPSHQSALYTFLLPKDREDIYLSLMSHSGRFEQTCEHAIQGTEVLQDSITTLYIYAEFNTNIANYQGIEEGRRSAVALTFHKPVGNKLCMRYGVSYISHEQARKNLQREIVSFESRPLEKRGRAIWNEALGKIKITAESENEARLFYTSLYRTYERMINISEDGYYYSGVDKQVHPDHGSPYYTDDWIWDTYRATHPLRLLIDPVKELQMIRSFLRMSDEDSNGWLATFPEITGDSRRMNSNHGVAVLADAYAKGLNDFDLGKGYEAARKAIQEKTLAPWSDKPAGELDAFYRQHGYFPALPEGVKESAPEVHSWENRQAIAVTLGTAYDYWCLGRIAEMLGKTEEAEEHYRLSLGYRNVFNPATNFFHPKDQNGDFIMPFDYTFSGGQGARAYYGENNGWVYRWDLPFNVADLIDLMGGKDRMIAALDSTLQTPMTGWKFNFFHRLPDHTANIGQFSMSNEPSLHVPYLYNYAGQPWRTQKLIRTIIHEWFRNDLMGMPGDEDGGGMSAFIVFSMLGFYPMPVGLPVYVIGTPMVKYAEVSLSIGKKLVIHARSASLKNKYIKSVRLNGRPLLQPWFTHEDIADGGTLEFTMGPEPNYTWGTETPPPSFKMPK